MSLAPARRQSPVESRIGMTSPQETVAPTLVRGLGAWGGAMLTIGGILGSAIFITTGDIARVVPHTGLILVLWVAGGLLTLAGALTYAELGALFPESGGQYQFLKEAYGPLWGFLFGWTSFFVIQSGGIAALAAGFGEYLGSFVPALATTRVLATLQVGPWVFSPTGGQATGAAVIVALTAVNYLGLRQGARLQAAVTIAGVAAVLGLVAFGLAAPATASPHLLARLPEGRLLAGLGVGMIAVFWAYDGWYDLTFSAGEVRDPGRNLPRGLIIGTSVVIVLYALMNLVYARAVPLEAMAETSRIGEAAALALFGPIGARLLSAAVLVSIFGCLSASILSAARVYLPMAEDGLFFGALARIHPVYRTPGASLVAQGVWSIVLVFSGSYQQLYTYVVFALVVFHAATGVAVFVLRRARPDVPRPYRAWGYPLVPAVFVSFCLALMANTLAEKPWESLIGLGIVAAGLPAYAWWRSHPKGGPR
jgi:basic amino acid/polyamine antiporter, APA family